MTRRRTALLCSLLLALGVAATTIPAASAAPRTERIAGVDRYATAAAVSASAFSPGVAVAYVATGTSFPDALAGGAAAGLRDAPVLLVARDEVPAATPPS
jgi:hypothetical protein